MLQYLFVILDTSANSFCYYRNPTIKSKLIDLQLLKDVVFFAQKENMLINFLNGKEKLPQEYLEVMNSINHIVISPLESQTSNNEDILVLDYNCDVNTQIFEKSKTANVIVRIEKKYLSNLASIIKEIKGYKRLSILLLDIDTFTENDFEEYRKQLVEIENSFITDLKDNSQITELNTLSDRLALTKMNNCEAGVVHITFAPNGKFYICPAFYFNDESDSIGDLIHGINIKNQQLYTIEFAPICKNCDAFQCKRCIYLNRKTTLEVNTPSHEQCVVSHLERNCTKDLLDKVQYLIPELADKEIIETDYLDPIEKIIDNYSH